MSLPSVRSKEVPRDYQSLISLPPTSAAPSPADTLSGGYLGMKLILHELQLQICLMHRRGLWILICIVSDISLRSGHITGWIWNFDFVI